jgi:septal ring factor EnvC (AmiA/AmiB activator)
MDQGSVICRSVETTSTSAAPPPHPCGVRGPMSVARRRRLIWGIAGTALSVVGFLAMILFEQYNGMLSELRNDLKHFHETSADYVKRDSLQKIRDQLRECYKELQASGTARVQLEVELRASEKAREEMARELQRLRERLAYVEGWQTARPSGPAAER